MGDSGPPWREGSLPRIKVPCPRLNENSGSRIINRMEVLSTERVSNREKTCFPAIEASPAVRRRTVIQNQLRPAEILILHLNSPSPEAPLLLPPIHQIGETLLLFPAIEGDNQGQLSPQATSSGLLSKATSPTLEVSKKTQPEEICVATGAVRRKIRGLQPPVLPNHDVLNRKSKKLAGVHRAQGNGEIPSSGIRRYKRLKPSCDFKTSSEPNDELQMLDMGVEMETPAVRRAKPVGSCWNDPDEHLVRPQPPPPMMGRPTGTPPVRPVTRKPTPFAKFEPKPPAKSKKASSAIVKQKRLKKTLPASPKPHKEELSRIRALLKQCHERRGNSNHHLSHMMCSQRPLLERRAQMNCCDNSGRLCAPVPPSQRPPSAQRHRRCARLVGADGLHQ